MASFLHALGKRAVAGLSFGASPGSTSSEEDAVGPLFGLDRGGARPGGSSSKRRRGVPNHGRAGAAAPPPPSASADCETWCDSPAGAVFANPLFDAEEGPEADENLQGCVPYGWRLSESGDENVTPECGQAEEVDEQLFAEFGTSAGRSCPLAAFLAELGSTPVLCALTALQSRKLHPIGEAGYATLEVTIAGMLVLCRRANMGCDEITPELLLTCCWLLMGTCSQYYSSLKWNVALYMQLHPDAREMAGPLKEAMVALQLQMLERTSWRVLLRDDEELAAALKDLGGQPFFSQICDYVEGCADGCWPPLGTHGHSAAAAAAFAAEEVGAAREARTPEPSRRSGGSSRKAGGDGLDGSYWAQPPVPSRRSGSRRHQQEAHRGVLGPRNH